MISIHAPAKGATFLVSILSLIVRISIHAPAKGATGQINLTDDDLPISIHAPAKGATTGTDNGSQRREFQSTLPRRERPPMPVAKAKLASISIHAPAKGATIRYTDDSWRYKLISIHAPAKGATWRLVLFEYCFVTFQSTLPRRERPGDMIIISDGGLISIHAPAKGATLISIFINIRSRNFNPRSREGSDAKSHNHGLMQHYFNPRSREGSDQRGR